MPYRNVWTWLYLHVQLPQRVDCVRQCERLRRVCYGLRRYITEECQQTNEMIELIVKAGDSCCLVDLTVTGLCVDINECDSTPCDDFSTDECTNIAGSFSCNCSAGFQFFNRTHCAGSTRSLTYIMHQNSSRFHILIYFSCALLDIDECATTPCSTGSTCVNGQDMFTCICAPGFTGEICTESKNTAEILAHPSWHALILYIHVSCTCTYICSCADIDECASDPCQNGATCNDLINSFSCSCPDSFRGVLCEIFIIPSKHCHETRCELSTMFSILLYMFYTFNNTKYFSALTYIAFTNISRRIKSNHFNLIFLKIAIVRFFISLFSNSSLDVHDCVFFSTIFVKSLELVWVYVFVSFYSTILSSSASTVYYQPRPLMEPASVIISRFVFPLFK